jgi:hypothetical protein
VIIARHKALKDRRWELCSRFIDLKEVSSGYMHHHLILLAFSFVMSNRSFSGLIHLMLKWFVPVMFPLLDLNYWAFTGIDSTASISWNGLQVWVIFRTIFF